MTREQAICWCKLHLTNWARSTKYQHPDDWRWVINRKPYQEPTFTLVNGNHEEINEGDVT